MADSSVEAASGSGGPTFATDEITGEHFPVGKLAVGAYGTANLLTGGAGTTDGGTLRVTISSDSTGVITANPASGTIDTVTTVGTVTTITNDVGADIQLAGTAVTAGAGAVAAGTPRVTLASDDPGVALLGTIDADTNAIKTAVEGTLTVGSHAVTNAGTFVVQEDGDALTALQLIDDVVYTDDTDTHATGTSKGALIMAAATPTDGSVGANDIGAVAMSLDRRMHVDAQLVGQDADITIADGGNTITVDGTVTVDAGTNTSTAGLLTTTAHDAAFGTAGTADAQVRSVQGIAGGTALEVDLGANNDVTVTSGTIAATQSGTWTEANSAAIKTAVEGTLTVDLTTNNDVTIDGSSIVHAEDAVHNSGDAGIMPLAVRSDSLGTLASGTGDYTPLQVNANGSLYTINQHTTRTAGGTTAWLGIDIDEGALEQVKGSGGTLYWLHCINLASSVRFLKIYNATSGTIGTGTPLLSFPIPTQGDTNGAGFTINLMPFGVNFDTGICVGASTGVAHADTGAPGANEVILNLGYS